MTIGQEMLGACQCLRNILEGEYLPHGIGDRFNGVEGLGALCYQPCIYSLSKAIRVFEKDSSEGWALRAQQVTALAMVAITSVIAAVGFVVKKIGSFMPHDRTPRTDAVFVRTAPEKIDQVYDVIQEFSAVAAEIGLDYKMCSGTALGAIRHHGIIPWDDDGDFVMLNGEREKVERAIKDGVFQKRGLEAQFYPGMENYQIRFTDEEKGRRGYSTPAAIDLFLMESLRVIENGKSVERIGYSSTFIAEHFPHDYFTSEEWNHSEEWAFGPGEKIRLRGLSPEDTERYVQRAYGKDCLTCGLKTHQHTEINLFGYRFSALGLPVVTREKVKLVDFTPAQGVKWKN